MCLLTLSRDIYPTKLKQKAYSPVGLAVSARLRTKDGTHPPALKTLSIEADKNSYVDTTGYPTCTSARAP